MKFTALFASAQAVSIFSLLPAALQNSIEFVYDGASKPGNKVPVPGNTSVVNCEVGRPQMLNITDLTLTPPLPVAGQPLVIEATAALLSNVTNGSYVDVMIHYGTYHVIKSRYDLCTYLPEVGYECPTGPGEISFSKTIDVPETLPSGEYVAIAKAFDANEDMLTCLFADVTLGL